MQDPHQEHAGANLFQQPSLNTPVNKVLNFSEASEVIDLIAQTPAAQVK